MFIELLRIIIKTILFFAIPILICVLFFESIIVGHEKELLLYSDLLESFTDLTLWMIWVCILSLWLFVISFQVMKARLFIVSCITWSIILTSVFFIYSQPISGLIEIPDSVFAFSWVDIHNIPRLTPETCSEMKKLTNDLGSISQLLFFSSGSEAVLWRELSKNNLEKSEYVNYLLFLNGKLFAERSYPNDFLSAISIDDMIWIKAGTITKTNLLQRFPEEKKDKYLLSEFDREKRESVLLNKWNQYLSTLSWSLNKEELISVTYSSDDLKKIERLIEIVNASTFWGYWYCMKENPQNLADELIPDMSSELKIERILLQYALIEASIWETEKAHKTLILIADNLILKEKQSYTLVWAMMNIAMKWIFYESLDIVKYIGYPENLLNWIYTKIHTFDEIAMMLNGYRWEYYLFSHLYMNTGTSLQKLYIPILLDGVESTKMLKNYYSSAMNRLDSSVPKWRYLTKDSTYESEDIFLYSSSLGSSSGYHTLNNPLWRDLLSMVLPSVDSFYKRFLLAEIKKNSILYPLTK